MHAPVNAKDYKSLLAEIKGRIRSAQYEALKAVNRELVALYWDIGKMIVTRQIGDTWGKAVVEKLADDLQTEFPGIGGFSARNIWRMRQFHLLYRKNKKLPPLVAEISWSRNFTKGDSPLPCYNRNQVDTICHPTFNHHKQGG